MTAEADDKIPNETGGLLFGYWVEQFREVVVTSVVGPGPGAEHHRSRFVPDDKYQEEELARLYQQHGRLQTYLGDWHTHPVGPAYLSKLDRRTLSKIASFQSARIPCPVMVVMSRGEDDWILAAWRWPGRGHKWSPYPRFNVRWFCD